MEKHPSTWDVFLSNLINNEKIAEYMCIRIILLLCICLMTSCQDKKVEVEHGVDILEVPLQREDDFASFLSHFDFSHIVPLETNDSCLIRFITKIQIYESQIYILDKLQKQIFTFNEEGGFLKRYKHLGQGPGEYSSLTDFSIVHDTLYLVDGSKGRLLRYRLDDTFIDEETIGVTDGVYVFSDRRWALNKKFGSSTHTSSCQCYAFYEDGKEVYQDIPFNEHLRGYAFTQGEGGNNFYAYDDSVFTFFPYNDTIYTVNAGSGRLTPYMAVRVGDERIRLDDDKVTVNRLRKKDITPTIHAFYKWGNYHLFAYFHKDNPCKYVLLKGKDNVLFHGTSAWDENYLPIKVVAYDTDSNCHLLLSVIRPYEIPSRYSDKSPILKKLSDNVSAEDNPILVFYRPTF
ncbi:6-bladed beta-propeller [uncultured Mediterranea sp.]|uniref:6-bladed beta-propeller n=1 Tax=uncultured Mediterranea sp. TaxID=1926662 RepID=UPI0028063BA1|nr:6-bladed beta-propeller [uncultured Mediterranea sp.]